MKADPQWTRAREAAAARGWNMPNNAQCRADCEAMAMAWFGDEVAELRAAALRSLDCLLSCVAPTGGCDDREAYEDAIAVLKRALKEPKP